MGYSPELDGEGGTRGVGHSNADRGTERHGSPNIDKGGCLNLV